MIISFCSSARGVVAGLDSLLLLLLLLLFEFNSVELESDSTGSALAPESGVSIARQTGQHFGIKRRVSSSSNSLKQTAHSSAAFPSLSGGGGGGGGRVSFATVTDVNGKEADQEESADEYHNNYGDGRVETTVKSVGVIPRRSCRCRLRRHNDGGKYVEENPRAEIKHEGQEEKREIVEKETGTVSELKTLYN
ncbi:hypothetical protein GQ457_02G009080 [Hibiscus cannabinus]